MEPPLVSNIRRIKRIAPLQLGKLSALLYGIMGLVLIPVFLVVGLFSSHLPPQQRGGFLAMGAGFTLLLPILYGAMGFIMGLLTAFIYNLAAKWIGGIEVEVE